MEVLYSDSLVQKIQNSKILVVGAGGIGCELLKNLVLSNFRHIEVIDLDTIDVSNLNRQFLFRKSQVGMPKAVIARESVLRMNPNVDIKAHHANIMSAQFDIDWFGSFDLVMNALDNVAARRYVNLMCLASNKCLVESGTAGYLGQTVPIVPNVTECFDCLPKPVPKTFPVCTIRTTPTQPIHCIVWAKFVLSELFGQAETSGLDEKETTTTALRKLRSNPNFVDALFKQLFIVDIESLSNLDEVWEGKTRPVPLTEKLFVQEHQTPSKKDWDMKVWSVSECIAVLGQSVRALCSRVAGSQDVELEFDKDDEDMLDFVVALSNLRARVFGIEMLSRFKCKEMAGSIIPAIATTNAMVAGLMVLHAIQLISKTDLNSLKNVYLAPAAKGRDQLLQTENAVGPNRYCTACSAAYCVLYANPVCFTLQNFLDKVVNAGWDDKGLDLAQYDEVCIFENDRVLYDPDFDSLLGKSFMDLKVKTLRVLVENELGEEATVNFILVPQPEFGEGQYDVRSSLFKKKKCPFVPKRQDDKLESSNVAGTSMKEVYISDDEDSDDSDVVIIADSDDDKFIEANSTTRKRGNQYSLLENSKKLKSS